MAGAMSKFGIENPVVGQFVFYSTMVVSKMMIMSFVTIAHRRINQTFSNPEDLKLATGKKEAKLTFNDQQVERVRRCHLNDIENIVPFVLIGSFYCLTGPDPYYAAVHFRSFAIARIFHSFAYLIPLPQPSRAACFMTGWVATASMAISTLRSVWSFM